MGRRASGDLPQMRRHKRSGTARVRINGREISLGRWGSSEARRKYHQVIADFIRQQDLQAVGGLEPEAGRENAGEGAAFLAVAPDAAPETPIAPHVGDPMPPTAADISIAQLCAAFLHDAEQTYRKPDGKPSSMLGNCKMGLRALQPYWNMPAAEFGPRLLRKLRDDLVNQPGRRKGPDGNRLPKFRKTINRTIDAIRWVFKWGVSMELVPPAVHQALQTVEGLKQGRTTAPDLPPVEAVPDADIERTLAHLPETVADMVRVHRLLGCRPSEVCEMRPCDLDRSGDVWIYEPETHKNQWRGHRRRVSVGPRAQAILSKYLDRPPSRPCFTPADSESSRNAIRRSHRKSPMTPSHQARRMQKRRKLDLNKPYTDDTYRRAVQRACTKAGVPVWSPNQLRHSAGEEARERCGLDGAQARLGHKHAKVTEVYAHQMGKRADEVARQLG